MKTIMSTESSLESQIGWLQWLQSDVKIFGPDQINMIKGYLHHTGVHTKLIEVFEQMREPLMHSINDKLYRIYNAARRDLIAHIDDRINRLTSLETPAPAKSYFRYRFFSRKKDFRPLRFDIQDLLMDIGIVVKYGIQEGSAIIRGEIMTLRQMLPGYIHAIDPKANGKLQSLISKLQKLEICISKNEFEKGHRIFLEIKEGLT